MRLDTIYSYHSYHFDESDSIEESGLDKMVLDEGSYTKYQINFNDANQIISEFCFDKFEHDTSERLNYKSIFEYDKRKRLKREYHVEFQKSIGISFESNSAEIDSFYYAHDQNDTLFVEYKYQPKKTIKFFDKGKKKNGREIMNYDKFGNLTKHEYYFKEDLVRLKEYKYNKQNKLVLETKPIEKGITVLGYSDDFSKTSKTEYFYLEGKVATEKIHRTQPDWTFKVIYEYKNNLKLSEKGYTEGMLFYEVNYEYFQ